MLNETLDKATLTTGIRGVADLYQKIETKGCATIKRFTFKESENPMYNLRAVRDGGYMFRIFDGDYVSLHVDGQLMMSDTPMERFTNKDFVQSAKGRVMIAGLGVGLIINEILKKDDVTEVIVLEKYQEVIDLVSPKFSDPRLKIIHADCFTYTFPKTEKFDTIYFDIWPDISTDNLEDMKILHQRYKTRKLSKDSYMESWMRGYLRKQKIRDSYRY